MAKLRKGHQKSNKANSWLARVSMITILLIGALVAVMFELPIGPINNSSDNSSSGSSSKQKLTKAIHREYLPSINRGVTIHHDFYSLSYVEDWEQSEWVAYELTKQSLQEKNVPRAKRFNEDKSVSTKSARHSDYTHSGFTRGHLAPAGDMAFDVNAMQQCFFMSNMSPQPRVFNNGIWKELEETIRDWAYKKDRLYIVTGPIFNDNKYETIGKSKVAVPDSFYKIIVQPDEENAISFIIPNELSNRHLKSYTISINKIEEITGLDFFENILDEDFEEKKVVGNWQFNEKKYNERVQKWNKQ